MHLNNMLLIGTPTLIKLFSNWKNHPAATLGVWRIQIFTEKCSCCFLTSNSSLAGKLDISSGQQNLFKSIKLCERADSISEGWEELFVLSFCCGVFVVCFVFLLERWP